MPSASPAPEYLHDDVFLTTSTARALYHNVAKELPIIDFHTHLPQDAILEDQRFENLSELWLEFDHYKWRLMRACGVSERYITGDASPWEKFEAFASILPLAIGNPVHHWAHLELRRVFGITTVLNKGSAKAVWDETNAQLASDPKLSVQGLLKHFKVELVCTTDDPTDDLLTHRAIAEKNLAIQVYPTFRPDALTTRKEGFDFSNWIKQLEARSKQNISNYSELLRALESRHDSFHEHGCRLSDHGLNAMPLKSESARPLEEIFQDRLSNKPVCDTDWQTFAFDILLHNAKWNQQKGWTMQLHLGPQRGVNTRMAKQCGADSGFDTMGSTPQTEALISALNAFSEAEVLGKTIVYNLNSVESEPICCALQNFQSDQKAGLIQYGPAWWHLDHARGIRAQIDILSSLGAIGTTVGMLTDSRSFTSYVRHEYYRRLLCQYLGDAAERGEIPNDPESLHELITNICYTNPRDYFGWAESSSLT